jgi:putative salt-induced outer membrane protein YdiY
MRAIAKAAGWSLLLSGTALSTVSAQDKPTTFTGDLGFVNAAGNTSVTTFNLGQGVRHTNGAWKLQQRFAALYGKTEGEKSAEQFEAGIRADYALSPRLAVYAQAGWDRNQFAGISRRFEEGVGLALKVVATERDELSVEAGLGATQQRSTLAVSNAYLSGRAAARYRHLLAEKAFVQQRLEFIPNFDVSDDYRIMSESTLVAPLSGAIALKVSYVVRVDNLPEPGFEKSDRILTTGVQLNW